MVFDNPRKPTVCLYRAVSDAELASLLSERRFRIVLGTTLEGKWFATTRKDAERWGEMLQKFPGNFSQPFSVVGLRFPADILYRFHYDLRLDGVGPAYYAAMQDLEDVDVVFEEEELLP